MSTYDTLDSTESQPLTGAKQAATTSLMWLSAGIIVLGVIAALSVTTAVLSKDKLGASTCSTPYEHNYSPPNLADPALQAKGSVFVKSCTLFTGTSAPAENPVTGLQDVLIVGGKIFNVGPNLDNPDNFPVVDAAGAYCTPGIVDMHSHIGGSSLPTDSFGNSDTNEATEPAIPFMRVRDGIDPYDPAIDLNRGGGITTSVILPGSADVMGGEAIIVKMRPALPGPFMNVQKNSVPALQIPGSPRILKFACGENPKRVFGSRNELPGSRMGIGYTFRQMFDQAKRDAAAQAEWDCQSDSSKSYVAPETMESEPLIALMQGEALAFVHCYKVTDMLQVIDVANEYGWKVAAFHHAIEAWMIADVLARENITVATFAQHGLFKMEGYRQNPSAGAIIQNAGAPLAYKSDHPVLFGRELYRQAGIGVHHGLDVSFAIPSITSVPAAAMGLPDRIGRVAVNYDGDLVIWNTYPLSAYAKAKTVILEGIVTDNRQDLTNPVPPPTIPTGTCDVCGTCPTDPATVYALVGIGELVTLADGVGTIATGTVIIQNGIITCVGNSTRCPIPGNATVYTFGGNSAATPGWISAGLDIGNFEVHSESNTWDGAASSTSSIDFVAVDGAAPHMYRGKHASLALGSGVLSTVLNPQSRGVVQGISSYIKNVGDMFLDDGIVAERVGLVVTIGNRAKGGPLGDFASISGQINYLRSNLMSPTGIWTDILNGTFPLFVRIQQRDAIASLLRLHTEYAPNARVVLIGALESAPLASRLAQKAPQVSVLLDASYRPFSFDTFNAIENTFSVLKAAGARVALAPPGEADGDADQIPWFGFDAAQLVTQPGVSRDDALTAISRGVAEICMLDRFGMTGTIELGAIANLVVWSGPPMEYGSQVLFYAIGGNVGCLPPYMNL